MTRTIALAALLAPLAACDALDSPPNAPWSPDFTEVAVVPVPEAFDVPADCGEVERWSYGYEDGLRTHAERFTDRRVADRVEDRVYDDARRIVHARAEWDGGWVDVTLERDPDGRVVRRVVEASESMMASSAELVERTPEREVVRYDGAVLLLDPFNPITDRNRDEVAYADLHDPLIDGDAMINALVRKIEAGEAIDPLFDPFEVVETRTFDGAGRPLRTEWDLTDDGRPEQLRDWTYADGGSRVTVEDDYDADGRVDHRSERLLDEAGRVLEESVDDDGDGTFDLVRTVVRDAAGEALQETTVSVVDGVETTRVVRYTVVDTAHATHIDEDGDGIDDHITTLWLRPDGQRVLKHEDSKADGVIDWQRRYVYDTEGRRAYSERDRDVDGALDLRWDYAWGADGLLYHVISTEPGSARCAGIRD